MKQIPDLFWKCVDQTAGPYACWPWTKGHFEAGYGAVVWGTKTRGAHVVAFELTNGSVPQKQCVLHSCDNRSCCNPNHLFAGSKKRSAEDAVSKDRHTRGERHGLAKLTDAKVLEILRRHHPRHPTNTGRALAKEFGVTEQLVNLVVKRKAWRHVVGPTV